MKAGGFEKMAHDLRTLVRLFAGKDANPTVTILDARTTHSTPESGARAGNGGHKKRNGSRIHAAVDTLGMLLALKVTAANEQERAQVGELVEAVQKVTGNNIEIAFCRSRLHRSRPRRSCRRAWRAT